MIVKVVGGFIISPVLSHSSADSTPFVVLTCLLVASSLVNSSLASSPRLASCNPLKKVCGRQQQTIESRSKVKAMVVQL